MQRERERENEAHCCHHLLNETSVSSLCSICINCKDVYILALQFVFGDLITKGQRFSSHLPSHLSNV